MALSRKEKAYLKSVAIPAFNAQFGFKYRDADFDVVEIPCNKHAARFGFEFRTLVDNDSLVIRAYFSLSNKDKVGKFRIHDEKNTGVGVGNEVFTADGQLSQQFLNSGNNYIRAQFLSGTEVLAEESVLLMQDGTPLLMGDNSYLLLQESV